MRLGPRVQISETMYPISCHCRVTFLIKLCGYRRKRLPCCRRGTLLYEYHRSRHQDSHIIASRALVFACFLAGVHASEIILDSRSFLYTSVHSICIYPSLRNAFVCFFCVCFVSGFFCVFVVFFVLCLCVVLFVFFL